MDYPPLGVPTLLVYRECPCGWWCATGEGALAPICPQCGARAVPGGGRRGTYGPLDDQQHPHTGRALYGLAFAAILLREQSVVGFTSRVRKAAGMMVPAPFEGTSRERTDRYYREADCRELSDEIVERP